MGDENTLAADTLTGIAAIAQYIGQPQRRATYLLESGRLPAGKLGRLWVASKSRLRDHMAALTGGDA